MNLLRLSTSPLPVPPSWYAVPLRLIVGFGFIQHGYAKLARGPEDFIGLLHAMGLHASFLLRFRLHRLLSMSGIFLIHTFPLLIVIFESSIMS
jgi:putative oxidoreductase